jgi:hypothetical protein
MSTIRENDLISSVGIPYLFSCLLMNASFVQDDWSAGVDHTCKSLDGRVYLEATLVCEQDTKKNVVLPLYLLEREETEERHTKKQKIVAAVNRTRGSCMASTNFTTKPLRLIYEAKAVDTVSVSPC